MDDRHDGSARVHTEQPPQHERWAAHSTRKGFPKGAAVAGAGAACSRKA
jgi:hypothetical protein